eukprot:TRINITY_DN39531_c0_g1_i1.p1 TRINITY_DN39531_c0_g1~~TRINITY_DN39531_c0_g1_i1.p1  ORF type:complete len:1575 (-),score=569.95 TRINITY_DN39531_c0_g1_i1:493-5013(-)
MATNPLEQDARAHTLAVAMSVGAADIRRKMEMTERMQRVETGQRQIQLVAQQVAEDEVRLRCLAKEISADEHHVKHCEEALLADRQFFKRVGAELGDDEERIKRRRELLAQEVERVSRIELDLKRLQSEVKVQDEELKPDEELIRTRLQEIEEKDLVALLQRQDQLKKREEQYMQQLQELRRCEAQVSEGMADIQERERVVALAQKQLEERRNKMRAARMKVRRRETELALRSGDLENRGELLNQVQEDVTRREQALQDQKLDFEEEAELAEEEMVVQMKKDELDDMEFKLKNQHGEIKRRAELSVKGVRDKQLRNIEARKLLDVRELEVERLEADAETRAWKLGPLGLAEAERDKPVAEAEVPQAPVIIGGQIALGPPDPSLESSVAEMKKQMEQAFEQKMVAAKEGAVKDETNLKRLKRQILDLDIERDIIEETLRKQKVEERRLAKSIEEANEAITQSKDEKRKYRQIVVASKAGAEKRELTMSLAATATTLDKIDSKKNSILAEQASLERTLVAGRGSMAAEQEALQLEIARRAQAMKQEVGAAQQAEAAKKSEAEEKAKEEKKIVQLQQMLLTQSQQTQQMLAMQQMMQVSRSVQQAPPQQSGSSEAVEMKRLQAQIRADVEKHGRQMADVEKTMLDKVQTLETRLKSAGPKAQALAKAKARRMSPAGPMVMMPPVAMQQVVLPPGAAPGMVVGQPGAPSGAHAGFGRDDVRRLEERLLQKVDALEAHLEESEYEAELQEQEDSETARMDRAAAQYEMRAVADGLVKGMEKMQKNIDGKLQSQVDAISEDLERQLQAKVDRLEARLRESEQRLRERLAREDVQWSPRRTGSPSSRPGQEGTETLATRVESLQHNLEFQMMLGFQKLEERLAAGASLGEQTVARRTEAQRRNSEQVELLKAKVVALEESYEERLEVEVRALEEAFEERLNKEVDTLEQTLEQRLSRHVTTLQEQVSQEQSKDKEAVAKMDQLEGLVQTLLEVKEAEAKKREESQTRLTEKVTAMGEQAAAKVAQQLSAFEGDFEDRLNSEVTSLEQVVESRMAGQLSVLEQTLGQRKAASDDENAKQMRRLEEKVQALLKAQEPSAAKEQLVGMEERLGQLKEEVAREKAGIAERITALGGMLEELRADRSGSSRQRADRRASLEGDLLERLEALERRRSAAAPETSAPPYLEKQNDELMSRLAELERVVREGSHQRQVQEGSAGRAVQERLTARLSALQGAMERLLSVEEAAEEAAAAAEAPAAASQFEEELLRRIATLEQRLSEEAESKYRSGGATRSSGRLPPRRESEQSHGSEDLRKGEPPHERVEHRRRGDESRQRGHQDMSMSMSSPAGEKEASPRSVKALPLRRSDKVAPPPDVVQRSQPPGLGSGNQRRAAAGRASPEGSTRSLSPELPLRRQHRPEPSDPSGRPRGYAPVTGARLAGGVSLVDGPLIFDSPPESPSEPSPLSPAPDNFDKAWPRSTLGDAVAAGRRLIEAQREHEAESSRATSEAALSPRDDG